MKAINFSQTLSNNSAIELNYEYDFDENGVFYYLGTMSIITNWRNPNVIGQIKVFCSSLGKGRLSDFVGRDQVNLRTMNEPQSYFGVDFGEERTIIPTAYSIKNRNSSSHVLLCWQLEGSNDRINFEALDTRLFIHSDPKIHLQLEKERNILKSPGCSSTWAVDTSVKNKYPNGFRYLVLRQIGKNSSGAFNMGLSGFEVYGKCIGKRWIFK